MHFVPQWAFRNLLLWNYGNRHTSYFCEMLFPLSKLRNIFDWKS